MSKFYQYRRGDGNEGNFPRAIVELKDTDCAFAALRACVLSDYIAGRSVRRFISNNMEIDGESDAPMATVYKGPKGEQAFDEAWLTAELEPMTTEDVVYQREQWAREPRPIREYLDRGALLVFRKHNKVAP